MKTSREASDSRKSIAVEDCLAAIVEQPLSAVVFVQDYLQLVFNGACLTCYNWPTVQTESGTVFDCSHGFRDTICSQLASVVTKVDIMEDRLVITFSNGSDIGLSLVPTEESGVEAGVFSIPAQGILIVWN